MHAVVTKPSVSPNIRSGSHMFLRWRKAPELYHTHAIHRWKAEILSFQKVDRSKKSDERILQGSRFSEIGQGQKIVQACLAINNQYFQTDYGPPFIVDG